MPKKFSIGNLDSTHFLCCQRGQQEKNETLKNIVSYLKSFRNPCQTVIMEDDYVDRDYQDEFATFYSKSFRRHPSRCTRFHFFSGKLRKVDIKNIGKFQDDYLGFVILRPTMKLLVGRTLLKRENEMPENEFVHCLAKYSAHVLGHKLTVVAMPFTQQDSQVGACAQASLWMAARYMSARFGDREFMPSQITALAKQHSTDGRLFPADRGLDYVQMLDALQGMGYPSEVYHEDNIGDCARHIDDIFKYSLGRKERKIKKSRRPKIITLKLADIAYRYIESGLPVLFLTDDHAYVGIGHTLDHSKKKIRTTIERIPAFITNNDAAGPYRKSQIWKKEKDDDKFGEVTAIITLIPNEVILRGEQAEVNAWETIAELSRHRSAGIYEALLERPQLFKWWTSGPLIFRTYLMKSVELQADLLIQKENCELDAKVCDKLIRLDYPKYVWITEITSSSLLNDKKQNGRKCLGCVIQDSTAPSSTITAIAGHFFDMLITFHHQDRNSVSPLWRSKASKRTFTDCPDSTPFPPKQMARFQSTG